ncbi:Uncharacterised protein [Mycobacteroides abscessus subsp. abscessus]|nr:Uncharacterised protein [Mycobacteroides abscessus subsp. abscessus]
MPSPFTPRSHSREPVCAITGSRAVMRLATNVGSTSLRWA